MYRLCMFFFFHIFLVEYASICVCIVISQYYARPQFFIQTNIPDNDLQDADHSSLISIFISYTTPKDLKTRGIAFHQSQYDKSNTNYNICQN